MHTKKKANTREKIQIVSYSHIIIIHSQIKSNQSNLCTNQKKSAHLNLIISQLDD